MSTPPSINPRGDRVLVEVIEQAEDKNGLYVPESAKERPTQAIVVAAGPGAFTPEGRYIPLFLVAGDKVLISPFAGTVVKHLDKTYRLLDNADVLATIS